MGTHKNRLAEAVVVCTHNQCFNFFYSLKNLCMLHGRVFSDVLDGYLMPRLHLPRSPYDFLVCDFPYDSARSLQGLRTASVSCHYDVSTAYGHTSFNNLSNCRLLQNRRGYGDRKCKKWASYGRWPNVT